MQRKQQQQHSAFDNHDAVSFRFLRHVAYGLVTSATYSAATQQQHIDRRVCLLARSRARVGPGRLALSRQY